MNTTLDESTTQDDSQLEPTPAKRQKLTDGEVEPPATEEADGEDGVISAEADDGKEEGEVDDEETEEPEVKQKRKRNAKSRSKARKDAQVCIIQVDET